jgi:hypothetical protein
MTTGIEGVPYVVLLGTAGTPAEKRRNERDLRSAPFPTTPRPFGSIGVTPMRTLH